VAVRPPAREAADGVLAHFRDPVQIEPGENNPQVNNYFGGLINENN
jgi:hypothetical protein